MRNRLTLLGAMFALMFFHSCSDDVVNGVFVPEKEDVDREKSSLTVTLENLEITEGLVAGVLDRNIFDEHGGVEDVSKSDLLLQEPVTSSKVEFDDLTAYYKTNIYVNVFKEDGDLFTPVTNRTSQLEYFVTFGRVEKTIDCGAADTDPIKQTVISGTVPAEYVGKDLYLVLKENREAFITSIQAGGDIDEGTYEGKCTSEDTEVKFVIDTPSFVKSYSVFLPTNCAWHSKRQLRARTKTYGSTYEARGHGKRAWVGVLSATSNPTRYFPCRLPVSNRAIFVPHPHTQNARPCLPLPPRRIRSGQIH